MRSWNYLTTPDRISLRYGLFRPEKENRRGTVVLLGGRFEFMEKYIETAEELNERGFTVFTFDWRGQGLSSRMLPFRHRGYVADYADYIRDLEFFMDTVVPRGKDEPRLFLAHSMGAHIVLRYLHHHPDRADGAVLVSPMIDVRTDPFPKWLARLLAKTGVRYGFESAYVPGGTDYILSDERYRGNRLTSDYERFSAVKREVVKNSALALGGVTYGWLDATFRSVDILTAPGYLEGISLPVLMVTAGRDRVVSREAQEKVCRNLRNCRFRTVPEALHEILMERDPLRAQFWLCFDDFTAEKNVMSPRQG